MGPRRPMVAEALERCMEGQGLGLYNAGGARVGMVPGCKEVNYTLLTSGQGCSRINLPPGSLALERTLPQLTYSSHLVRLWQTAKQKGTKAFFLPCRGFSATVLQVWVSNRTMFYKLSHSPVHFLEAQVKLLTSCW